MKKRILITITALTTAVTLLTACGNQSLIDTTYRFDKAIINLHNGNIVEGKVQSWKDYDNSDQIQLTINGKTYLTHISNVILIAE